MLVLLLVLCRLPRLLVPSTTIITTTTTTPRSWPRSDRQILSRGLLAVKTELVSLASYQVLVSLLDATVSLILLLLLVLLLLPVLRLVLVLVLALHFDHYYHHY